MTLVQNNAQAAEDDEEILGKEEVFNEGFYIDIKGAIEKVHALFDVYAAIPVLTSSYYHKASMNCSCSPIKSTMQRTLARSSRYFYLGNP